MLALLLLLAAQQACGEAERARGYRQVGSTCATSFALVGITVFGWSAPRVGAVPALLRAQRWGRVSAGFSGGRALSQVLRDTDDEWCAVAGACTAGLLGASSIAQIPLRVCSFGTLSYIFEAQLSPRIRESSWLVAMRDPSRFTDCESTMPTESPKVRDNESLKPRIGRNTKTPWGKVQRFVDHLNHELGHY